MNRMYSSQGPTAFATHMIWADARLDGMVVAAATDNDAIIDGDLAFYLSEPELNACNLIIDVAERRHYMFRRAFQRVFVHQALAWTGPIHEISLVHQRDRQPVCVNVPTLNLSFSSSGSVVLACASLKLSVGIDVEKSRTVENVTPLAKRFFSLPESNFIRNLPGSEQSLVFLQHWTAKEAGLKALGKGIESGLNSFVLVPRECGYTIQLQQEFGTVEDWILTHMEFLPGHVVAVVHRAVNNLGRG